MRFRIFIILFSLSVRSIAQNPDGKECINEIIKLEEKFNIKDFKEGDKPVHFSYHVRTTDWDEQTVVSDVTMYRDKYKMHFFSDQATIYQDEKEVYVVLKSQKVVVINSTKKEINSKRESDDFVELRKEFLLNCTVIKCAYSKNDSSLKTIELKANDDMNGALNIIKMIYTYNPKTGTIINTTVQYDEDYKVKEIVIDYKTFELQSDYKFNTARKYVMSRNNRLLSKYTGYEVVDNRNTAKQ